MLIDVKENGTGFLLPINFKDLPYNPKRFFVIKNKYVGAIRGQHAHKIDKQILICLNGKVCIKYENKQETGIKYLQFGQTYLSKEHEWLEIEMIEENSILLVLCSIDYDESEYIRDYQEFKKGIL